MTNKNPLLTRWIARRLKGSDNAALQYLHNQDAPPTEQTVYRVLGRASGNVYQESNSADGSVVFAVPLWLGRLGLWAIPSELVWVQTMNTQWAASLLSGTLVDVTARVYQANSNSVRLCLWRESDA